MHKEEQIASLRRSLYDGFLGSFPDEDETFEDYLVLLVHNAKNLLTCKDQRIEKLLAINAAYMEDDDRSSYVYKYCSSCDKAVPIAKCNSNQGYIQICPTCAQVEREMLEKMAPSGIVYSQPGVLIKRRKDMNTVYAVIRYFDNESLGIVGVFTSPELAKKACLNESYGFGPVVLNKVLSDDIPWKEFKFFNQFES